MAEKLHLHLLELARAEGEVARCNFIAETFALLRDAERHLHPAAVHHVAEVDEHALRRLRPEERLAVVALHSADVRLEHQVELTRLGQRSQFLRIRGEHLVGFRNSRQIDHLTVPRQLVRVLGFKFEMLKRAPGDLLLRVAVSDAGDKHLLFAVLHPCTLDVVVAVATLALAAVDHQVVEQVIMPGGFPDARVHDDRRLDAGHLERARRTLRLYPLIVRGDHVRPPGVFNVALQLDAKRTVIPQTVETAVNF